MDDGLVDVPALTDLIARGRPVDRFPRLLAPTLRYGAQVLVDRGGGMQLFRRDQNTLVETIRAVVGEHLVDVGFFSDVPLRGTGPGARWTWTDYRPPEYGRHVLLLTDFGIGGPPGEPRWAVRGEWEEFATTVTQVGCDITALCPYPPERLPDWVSRLCRVIHWDRSTMAWTARGERAGTASARRHSPHEVTGLLPVTDIELPACPPSGALELAMLLSFATRIEPELIRAVRLDLLPHLTAADEADLWFCDWVGARSSEGIALLPRCLPSLRAALMVWLERAPELRKVEEVVTQLHRGLSPALALEERMTWASMNNQPEVAGRYLGRALHALRGENRSGLADWFAGSWERLPREIRSSDVAWTFAHAVQSYGLQIEPDPESDVNLTMVADVRGAVGETVLGVLREGHRLWLGPPGARTAAVIPVPDTHPRVVEVSGGTLLQTVRLANGEEKSLSVGPGPVSLRTGTGQVYEIGSGATSTVLDTSSRNQDPVNRTSVMLDRVQERRILWDRALMRGLREAVDHDHRDDDDALPQEHSRDRDLSEMLIRRAREHLDAGRFDEAVIDCTAAIEIDPQNAVGFRVRGEAHFMADRFDEAGRDLNASFELDPHDAKTLWIRGRMYRYTDRFDEAFADLTRAHELDPFFAGPLTSRGVAFLATERFDEALIDLTAAIKLDPQDAQTFWYRGRAYIAVERWDEAIADLTRAHELDPTLAESLSSRGLAYICAERFDEALIDLTAAIELDSQDPETFCLRGELHREDGRFDEAVADQTAALNLRPDYVAALAARGQAYREAGRFDEAVADQTAALALDPDYALALAQRGEAYREIGRLDEAVTDFTAALDREPDYAWALGSRGQAHREAGRLDEAVTDFTAALGLKPDYAWALAQRGEAYREAGRFDEAVTDFTATLGLKPDFAWALAQRGEAYREAGRFDEAVTDFTATLGLKPDFSWALAQRGEAYREAGRFDEAVTDFTATLGLKPDFAWALAQRGEAYREAGRFDEAVTDFTATLGLKPDFAWALAQRGEAYREAGRFDEAVTDFTATLGLKP
ncbi:tetratricopeptide repeat protein, partial [Streptomyces microflavus]|uniref:tetratricopeptide repeat protein n=1 Tax=Streptomyces microflavus TaxID=1919 RepID=UPI0035E07207